MFTCNIKRTNVTKIALSISVLNELLRKNNSMFKLKLYISEFYLRYKRLITLHGSLTTKSSLPSLPFRGLTSVMAELLTSGTKIQMLINEACWNRIEEKGRYIVL